MRNQAGRFVFLLSLLMLATGPTSGQAPASRVPIQAAAGEADPGVRPVRLIDRDESGSMEKKKREGYF